MELVAPSGPVYQAGTLSGNPLAMAAGLATVEVLLQPGVFASIARLTSDLVQGIREAAMTAQVPLQVASVGTMFGFYFLTEGGARITDYAGAKTFADVARYRRFFQAMLMQGIYFAPGQFEAGFMSYAHNRHDIQMTCEAIQASFQRLFA